MPIPESLTHNEFRLVACSAAGFEGYEHARSGLSFTVVGDVLSESFGSLMVIALRAAKSSQPEGVPLNTETIEDMFFEWFMRVLNQERARMKQQPVSEEEIIARLEQASASPDEILEVQNILRARI